MHIRPLLFATALLCGLVLAACGEGDSIVEPGPGETESTTTVPEEDDGDGDGSDSGEVVTDGSTTTNPGGEENSAGDPADEDADADIEEEVSPPETFVIDEQSENAAAFTELAVSGLVLSLDEQACADETAATAVADGTGELDAIIGAVQDCASAAAIDDFSSELIIAGGAPLPATEAACVSSRLQTGDEYQPFWAALLEEEPFDFLLADLDVQNRYLDLYTECVSVGRAVSSQADATLSVPTSDCIDGLYDDREFVRVTIEADLSGNVEDQQRINDQIAGCLTADERSALGLE